jgi:hypothetical protein
MGMGAFNASVVMPGLVPGIHAVKLPPHFDVQGKLNPVDPRNKSGGDA